jgi:hypothetical protein
VVPSASAPATSAPTAAAPPPPALATPASPAAASSPTPPPVAPAATATTKPPAKAPVAQSPAPAPTQANKEVPPAATASAPATPSLDLKSLEARLRETKAIGVLTKLTLKNQVDDLLDQFRMYYQGKLKTTLTELRKSYDLLVLKVLALLQDADAPLAKSIAMSREAIWGILSDPVKFSAV